MNMKLNAFTALAGIVGSIGLVTASQSIASAADGCDSNRVCIFDDNDFKNRLGQRPAGEGRKDMSSTLNDRMDSWKNRTSTNAAWYYNFIDENSDNCRNMNKNSSDDNINVFNSDELSSWRTNRGC